jgi:hypothetical protein
LKEIHKAIIFFALFVLFSAGAVVFALSDVNFSGKVDNYFSAKTDEYLDNMEASALEHASQETKAKSSGSSTTPATE